MSLNSVRELLLLTLYKLNYFLTFVGLVTLWYTYPTKIDPRNEDFVKSSNPRFRVPVLKFVRYRPVGNVVRHTRSRNVCSCSLHGLGVFSRRLVVLNRVEVQSYDSRSRPETDKESDVLVFITSFTRTGTDRVDLFRRNC